MDQGRCSLASEDIILVCQGYVNVAIRSSSIFTERMIFFKETMNATAISRGHSKWSQLVDVTKHAKRAYEDDISSLKSTLSTIKLDRTRSLIIIANTISILHESFLSFSIKRLFVVVDANLQGDSALEAC